MRYVILTIIGLSFFAAMAEAEQSGGVEDAAMKAQNPLADIISMPLQWNTDFGIGPDDKTGSVLNIQPIYPVGLGKGRTLINRAIIPFPKTVPGGSSSGRKTGLGDITLMNWFSPEPKGAFMWGAGPVTVWPTATDKKLGTDKFSIGPSVVLVYSKPGKFVAASVINAWWDVAGHGSAPDVGVFYWQPIFNYFLPNRWYATTAPVITKDLEGESGQKWIVPLGGGIGKMFNWGNLPMDLTAQYYYYVEAPDAGPDWMFRLQLKFIFPK